MAAIDSVSRNDGSRTDFIFIAVAIMTRSSRLPVGLQERFSGRWAARILAAVVALSGMGSLAAGDREAPSTRMIPASLSLIREEGAPIVESVAPLGPAAIVEPPVSGEPGMLLPSESYFDGDYDSAFDCGGGCPPTWGGGVEWLHMRRNSSGSSLSSGYDLGDFPYEDGMRITLDRKYDCTHGWEMIYTGPFTWSQQATAVGAGNLSPRFVGVGIDTSAFQNGNFHQQLERSQFQSFEALMKSWGWDVIAVSFGTRYIRIDEQLAFSSVNNVGDVGLLNVGTSNDLFGAQLGLDMFYRIDRWSLDSTLKGGLFLNLAEANTFLSNAGAVGINNSVRHAEFASIIQGGTYARYHITPRLSFRAGYEFWWVYGLGLANEQFGGRISPNTGNRIDANGDIFYHGSTVGLLYTW